MITIIQDPDIHTFLKETASVLYAHEDEYGLLLGLAENIQQNKLVPKIPPVFLRILQDGKTSAIALQTPPMSLLLSHVTSEELNALVDYLKTSSLVIPGVMASTATTQAFCNLWKKEIKETFEQKLYRLDKVIPAPGAGKLIVADASMENLLSKWYREFAVECMPSNEHHSEAVAREHIQRYIQHQSAYVLLEGDEAVSMAVSHRKTKNGAAVGYVYTPPVFRKKGFASQTVAQLSQKLLDSGKTFCVLYTDASNPTSNKIYQDIGYNKISDSRLVLFS